MSICRKFLGLKLAHEVNAAMFVEIRYRCSNPPVAKGRQDFRRFVFDILLVRFMNPIGMTRFHRDCSA